jgi:hypothetical protein
LLLALSSLLHNHIFGVVVVIVCSVQKLGTRLKGALPAVEAAVLALSTEQLKAFQAAGSMEVGGHLLTTEEVLISREFKGEKTVYDACASPSGHLVVVVNHVVTEELRVMVRVPPPPSLLSP